jgi:hypothetical protein
MFLGSKFKFLKYFRINFGLYSKYFVTCFTYRVTRILLQLKWTMLMLMLIVDTTSEWIVEQGQEAQQPLFSKDELIWLEQTTEAG